MTSNQKTWLNQAQDIPVIIAQATIMITPATNPDSLIAYGYNVKNVEELDKKYENGGLFNNATKTKIISCHK